MDPRLEQWRRYRPTPRVQPSQPAQNRRNASYPNSPYVGPVTQPNQGQSKQPVPRKGCCGGGRV